MWYDCGMVQSINERRKRSLERYYKNKKAGKVSIKYVSEQVYKWRNKNPIKTKAHRLVFVEVRAGRMKKKPCGVCGNIKVEAHHQDYTKPLEVLWLCRKHHAEQHRKENRNYIT